MELGGRLANGPGRFTASFPLIAVPPDAVRRVRKKMMPLHRCEARKLPSIPFRPIFPGVRRSAMPGGSGPAMLLLTLHFVRCQ